MSTPLPSETIQHLTRLAKKLRVDPIYMANVLYTYQDQERLSDAELAHRLVVDETQLLRLALCKRPQTHSDRFVEQLRQLISYTGADQTALAQIIRQVEAIEHFQDLPATGAAGTEARPLARRSGLMAAARDREELDKEPTPDEKPNDEDESGS